MMQQAIGVIETCGMPSALVIADTMGKTANVQILGFENTDAGRISVIIQGTTGAVKAAIAAATSNLAGQTSGLLGHHILPCPNGAINIAAILHRRSSVQSDSLEWLDD